MVVGRLLSYWDGPFLGAMLNFGGVYIVVELLLGQVFHYHPSGCHDNRVPETMKTQPPHNEQFATETKPSKKRSHLASPFFSIFSKSVITCNHLWTLMHQTCVNPASSILDFSPRRRFNINSWCLEPSSGRKMFTKSGWPSTSKARFCSSRRSGWNGSTGSISSVSPLRCTLQRWCFRRK